MAEGLWNIGGFNLPDFGISEKLGLDRVGVPNNAAVYPKGQVFGATDQGNQYINQNYGGSTSTYSSPIGPGYAPGTTKAQSQAQSSQQPTNYSGDSQLTQLQKVKASGGLNPSQQSEYDRLIADLQNQQPDTDQLINEAYGASNDYLNQAENALRGDFPTILSEIEAQRAGALRTADTGKSQTLGTIDEQQNIATQRNQGVMSDARRLYDELRRGYRARFGGASSAGQAATELGNLEQQRQAGRIQQDFGNTLRQVEQARTQVEQKYQDQVYQLEQTTNQAKNEANRDFQNKLLQISQSRAENEQAKAQARLQALQDLRNKVYQIQLQNMQFQQTLQAQKQQADMSLSQYSSQLGGAGQQATNAVGGFNPSVSSSLQIGNTGGGQTPLESQYTGSISTGNRNQDDFLKSLGLVQYQ